MAGEARFGPFAVQGELGRSAQGVVLRAQDPRTGAPIALKLLLRATPADVQRFCQASLALARLDHPALAKLSGHGEVEGVPFLCTRLVEGHDLASAPGPLRAEQAANLVAHLARGLAHAHERGAAHEDVTARDVIVDARTGLPVLVGFGHAGRDPEAPVLAPALSARLAHTGQAPPAPPGPDERGPPADVRALGDLLARLVAGPADALARRAVPPALTAIVARALAADPEARPTAAALADALEAFGRASDTIAPGAPSTAIHRRPTGPLAPAAPTPPAARPQELIAPARATGPFAAPPSGALRRPTGPLPPLPLASGAGAASDEGWPEFVKLAAARRALAPDAAERLLAQARAAGRPPWELLAGQIGPELPARLLAELLAQERAGHEHVQGELGRGGMGRVLRVRDGEFGREVARKELLDPLAPAEVRLRFRREARVTAQLEHPCIVPVYEVQAEGPTPTFTMRLVKGRSLSEVVSSARGATDAAAMAAEIPALLRSFLRVCEAMTYAHERGVIHRDLKPQNVMVGDFGQVLVLDWGLAKVKGEADVPSLPGPDPARAVEADGTGDLTEAGALIGTPAYMPPEQTGEGEVDERSDVYSLGAILYELLTLRPPFSGGRLAILKSVLMDPPPPPRQAAPERRIPRELEAIALKALAKDKAARYPSARALADDVTRHLDGLPVEALPAGPLRRALLFAARRVELVASVTAALLALLAVAFVGLGVLARAAEGRASVAAGKAEAERAARAALEAHAAVESDRARLAEQGALAARRRADAIGAYLEVADLLPRNLPPAVALEVVRPALARSIAADPDFVEGHLALGRLQLAYGGPAAGRVHLEAAVDASRRQVGGEGDPGALHLLAATSSDPIDTRRLRERLARTAPRHPLGRLAAAQLLDEPRARRRALQELARELPHQAEVVMAHVVDLVESSRGESVDDARSMVNDIGDALDLLAPEPETRWRLAQCFVERAAMKALTREVAGALDDLTAAEDRGNRLQRPLAETVTFLVQLGLVYLRIGQEDAGLERLDRAVKLSPPQYCVPRLMRGAYRLSRGQAALARDDLAAAVERETEPTYLRMSAVHHLIAAAESGRAATAGRSAAVLLPALAADELAALLPPFPLDDLQGRLRASLGAVASALGGGTQEADRISRALEADAALQARLAGATLQERPRSARERCDRGLRSLDAMGAGASLGHRVMLLRVRARACLIGKDHDRAVADLETAMRIAGESSHAPTRRSSADDAFALACAIVRRGQARSLPATEFADQALTALESAVERGLDDAPLLRSADALAPLREHPRMQALLARLERR